MFDDQIEAWRPTLSKATQENKKEAKEFVRKITARHSKSGSMTRTTVTHCEFV